MSETTDTRDIYERIEAARQKFPTITRAATGQVGTRHYKYADLNSVVEAVEEPLRNEGVGIFHQVGVGAVTTVLRILGTHADGDGTAVRSTVSLTGDLTPQQTGSAITYFRRYNLVALLNLLTEDDDGAEASQPRTRGPIENNADDHPAQPPAFDAVANGWESEAAAQSAHRGVSERVRALPEGLQVQFQTFREEHGWPLPEARFAELETLLSTLEGLS